MLRRAVPILLVVVCVVVIITYQATRPAAAPADSAVFVPSPELYLDFSPSFRTSIADVYYLQMVQYFGEHVRGDGRFDALPQMVDLVTSLSPQFARAYLFGAFALVDAGRPDISYAILQRGFAENPDDYRFPAYLGFFVLRYGEGQSKNLVAAEWYRKADAIPGRPAFIPRLAATLLGKGGDLEKSVAMWGQVYLAGDEYSRQKAVEGLERILPEDEDARLKVLAPLALTMPAGEFGELQAALLEGSE